MNNKNIDIVVLWVDGSDTEWIKEKNKYQGKSDYTIDSSSVRYRDWGILKYWFRAVETNMPWVNQVFFITNGQCPDWLNFESPKLRFVKHSDYMPSEYLPTFSANPIELNLHRITDLSECFVFFNDDMFVMNPISKEYFFRKGYPVYPAALHSIVPLGGTSEEIMSHIYINDMTLINRNFSIKDLKKNWIKWFNPINAGIKNAALSFVLANHNGFVGFYNHHLPVPIRKSTISEIWQKESAVLHNTSLNKFRSSADVNQYIFRYWELARQTFIPIRDRQLGEYFVINGESEELIDRLSDYKGKMICINDSDIDKVCTDTQYEKLKSSLQSVFEKRFPQKSAFEL